MSLPIEDSVSIVEPYLRSITARRKAAERKSRSRTRLYVKKVWLTSKQLRFIALPQEKHAATFSESVRDMLEGLASGLIVKEIKKDLEIPADLEPTRQNEENKWTNNKTPTN